MSSIVNSAPVQGIGYPLPDGRSSARCITSTAAEQAGGVPHEEVEVVLVKLVEVERMACSFSSGPEGDFAQAADFAERVWDLRGCGQVDSEAAGLVERSEGCYFACQLAWRNCGNDGLRLRCFIPAQSERVGLEGIPVCQQVGAPAEILDAVLGRVLPARHRRHNRWRTRGNIQVLHL